MGRDPTRRQGIKKTYCQKHRGTQKIQENHQAKEQVLNDEQVARIIAEAGEREEQLRQGHSAQITENDEKTARSLFWEEQDEINKEFIKRQEHATRIFKEDRDRTRANEEEKRQRQECTAQNIQEDETKRARRQKKQYGGRYDTLPQVSLTAMTNLRGLDFSGNKATLVQRLMEDDNRREHVYSKQINRRPAREESMPHLL